MCTHAGRLFLGSLTYEVTGIFTLNMRTTELVKAFQDLVLQS